MSAPLRTIKSWVSRIGSLSPLQKTLLSEQKNKLYVPVGSYDIFRNLVIARPEADIALDIGFGDGTTLIALAQRFPEKLILGFEPHLAGVASALVQITQLNLNNILIFQGDALDYLEDESVLKASRLHLYFSDPWPKTRHHKRRLVQPKFLALLARRLQIGALVHIATDWKDYADHIQETIDQQKNFKLINLDDIPADQQFKRPLTKYEQRGIAKGHTIREFYLGLADEIKSS